MSAESVWKGKERDSKAPEFLLFSDFNQTINNFYIQLCQFSTLKRLKLKTISLLVINFCIYLSLSNAKSRSLKNVLFRRTYSRTNWLLRRTETFQHACLYRPLSVSWVYSKWILSMYEGVFRSFIYHFANLPLLNSLPNNWWHDDITIILVPF